MAESRATKKPELGTCRTASKPATHWIDNLKPHIKTQNCVGWQALPPSPHQSTSFARTGGECSAGASSGVAPCHDPGTKGASVNSESLPPSHEGTEAKLTQFPKGFIAKHPTTYLQHSKRIVQLMSEGLHNGKAWKPEAFTRYNELEDQEAAPTVTVSQGGCTGATVNTTYGERGESGVGTLRERTCEKCGATESDWTKRKRFMLCTTGDIHPWVPSQSSSASEELTPSVNRDWWDKVWACFEQWQEIWKADRASYEKQYPVWLVRAAEEIFAFDMCDAWSWNDYVKAACVIIDRHFQASVSAPEPDAHLCELVKEMIDLIDGTVIADMNLNFLVQRWRNKAYRAWQSSRKGGGERTSENKEKKR